MFHEVKVYDAQGDLKKIISREELLKIHWKKLEKIKVSREENLRRWKKKK